MNLFPDTSIVSWTPICRLFLRFWLRGKHPDMLQNLQKYLAAVTGARWFTINYRFPPCSWFHHVWNCAFTWWKTMFQRLSTSQTIYSTMVIWYIYIYIYMHIYISKYTFIYAYLYMHIYMSIYGPYEFPPHSFGWCHFDPNIATVFGHPRDPRQVISLVMLQLCTLFMLPVERALFMTGLVSLGDDVVMVKMWWTCGENLLIIMLNNAWESLNRLDNG